MSVQVSVDARGLKRLVARAALVFRPRVLLKGIGMAQLGWIIRNFESDGGLVGGWRPLSPNTVAGRRQGSSRPLQDTGRLRMSFGFGRPGNVFTVDGGSVTIGTNVAYAGPHEHGVAPQDINPILPKTQRTYVGRNARGRALFRGGVLRFMTPGGPVFVASVRNHPGIPMRKMLPPEREAAEVARDVIEGAIEELTRSERHA